MEHFLALPMFRNIYVPRCECFTRVPGGYIFETLDSPARTFVPFAFPG